MLDKYLRLIRDYSEFNAPLSEDEVLDNHFVYSQHNLGYAEYISEEFLLATQEERILMKKEIEHVEREIIRLESGE